MYSGEHTDFFLIYLLLVSPIVLLAILFYYRFVRSVFIKLFFVIVR